MSNHADNSPNVFRPHQQVCASLACSICPAYSDILPQYRALCTPVQSLLKKVPGLCWGEHKLHSADVPAAGSRQC